MRQAIHDCGHVRITMVTTSNHPCAEPELGRELHSLHEVPLNDWLCAILSVAGLVSGAFVSTSHGMDFWPGAVPGAVLGTIVALLINRLFRRSFVIHEHGVCKRSPLRSFVIRDDEIATFACSVTRTSLNGIPTGTDYALDLFQQGQLDQPCLTYRLNQHRECSELEHLKQRLANRLASRQLGWLVQGQVVPWFTNCQLTPAGLQIDRTKLFAKTVTALLPYDDLTARLEEGVCRISSTSTGDEWISTPASCCGFWSGYAALGWLVEHFHDGRIEAAN